MHSDVVELNVADPTWPAQFVEEADAIGRALGAGRRTMQFEHVGSTAVPGLLAKPIIDLLLIPVDGEWPGVQLRAALEGMGYVFWEDNPNPHHLFFVKGMPPFGTGRTHHVHIRPRAEALPILAFRDELRRRPDLARAYEQLKLALANRYPHDREAYTRGKDDFVARVLAGIGATEP